MAHDTRRTAHLAWGAGVLLALSVSCGDSGEANDSEPATGGVSSGSGGADAGSGGASMATGGHLSNAGGSGGSGAGGTSGGAAGAGGSHLGGAAGSPASGGGGGDDTCGCVVPELVWGPNGGLVAYAETSELSCDTFSLTVTPTQTDPPSEACTTIITSCENMVSPAELQTAVEHPDVQAALLAAPVLYGADTRVLDVPVLRITVDGARIEVGAECSDCEGIPEGVSVFAELLEQLTREQRMTSECNF